MKRYSIPRLAFINKLDRQGCNPDKIVQQLRNQLKLNAVAVQIPLGLENNHNGIIDIIEEKVYTFDGERGEHIKISSDIPEEYKEVVQQKRMELIECLSDVDDDIAELFLMEEIPDIQTLKAAIRKQVIACKLVPVFMGSAFKNKGVQPLLDGVVDYLPAPYEKTNYALDRMKNEELVPVIPKNNQSLLALAFKLDETTFGQLTYMRIYQGMLKKGNTITNVNDGKKVRLSRIVRMHSNEMEEIDSVGSGEVVAMFGIDCKSMDTFSDGAMNLAMSTMYVPEPVMSISIKPKKSTMQQNFAKALSKFTKEDPTLRIRIDNDTRETVLSGMGELHLDIYIERMLREYNVECITSQPNVKYKETIGSKTKFDYLHKKQTGGAGQYARVLGFIEPLTEEEKNEISEKASDAAAAQSDNNKKSSGISPNLFENRCIGTNIPPEYYSSCEKGMNDAMEEGALVGAEVDGIRVVLEDGAAHAVDSSDQAFRTCMANAIRDAMKKANSSILEPIMKVEVEIPSEFQGSVVAGISRRMGLIQSSDMNSDGSGIKIIADVPLVSMFGYSTELRSLTQGKGEFSMEYYKHMQVPRNTQDELMEKYKKERNQSVDADVA